VTLAAFADQQAPDYIVKPLAMARRNREQHAELSFTERGQRAADEESSDSVLHRFAHANRQGSGAAGTRQAGGVADGAEG